MLLYQFKTSPKATEKLHSANDDDHRAQEVLDGLKWRLNRDPFLGAYTIDADKDIYMIKSSKELNPDLPVLVVLYQVSVPFKEILIRDLLIVP